MPYYSDFWRTGGVLGPAWANRPDLTEVAELEDRDHPLEMLDMGAWLHLPETAREAVVAAYLGAYRTRTPGHSRTPEDDYGGTRY